MVSDLLPGPQEPWDVSQTIQQYFETGVYSPPARAKNERTDEDVKVEVYSLSEYDQLDSLFDTYDLMSRAKAAGGVMYMTLTCSSRLVDLRKKIALWKSAGNEAIGAERVRLWHIGHTRAQCGPTLAFDLITDLNVPLARSAGTLRFWMEAISDGKW